MEGSPSNTRRSIIRHPHDFQGARMVGGQPASNNNSADMLPQIGATAGAPTSSVYHNMGGPDMNASTGSLGGGGPTGGVLPGVSSIYGGPGASSGSSLSPSGGSASDYGGFVPQRSAPPPPGSSSTSLTGASSSSTFLGGPGIASGSGAKSGFVGRSAPSVAQGSTFVAGARDQRASYVSGAGPAVGLGGMSGNTAGHASIFGRQLPSGIGGPGPVGGGALGESLYPGGAPRPGLPGPSYSNGAPQGLGTGGSPTLLQQQHQESPSGAPMPPRPVRSFTTGPEHLPALRAGGPIGGGPIAGLSPGMGGGNSSASSPLMPSLPEFGAGAGGGGGGFTSGLDFSDGPAAGYAYSAGASGYSTPAPPAGGASNTGTFRARDPNRNTFKSVFGGFVNSMSGGLRFGLRRTCQVLMLLLSALQMSSLSKRGLRSRHLTIRCT